MDSFFLEDPSESVDPAADFLAREQAILGADAALFGNTLASGPATTITSALAVPSGFEVDSVFGANSTTNATGANLMITSSATSPLVANTMLSTEPKDKITSIGSTIPSGGVSNIAFGASPTFSSTSVGNPVNTSSISPGFGTATSSAGGLLGTSSMSPDLFSGAQHLPDVSSQSMPISEAEPQAVKEWREAFQTRIAEKESRAKERHERRLKEARESLDKFYGDYNDKKAKAIAKNKDKAKADLLESPTGNVWEKVVNNIDLTNNTSANNKDAKLKEKLGKDDKKDEKKKPVKTADTSRMKEVLLSLKKDVNAPGSSISAGLV